MERKVVLKIPLSIKEVAGRCPAKLYCPSACPLKVTPSFMYLICPGITERFSFSNLMALEVYGDTFRVQRLMIVQN